MLNLKNILSAAIWALVAGQATSALAGSSYIDPGDTNGMIRVKNAIVHGNETTVLFSTSPYSSDPEARNPCPHNYYTATLKPGLAKPEVNMIAKGVCAGVAQEGHLLKNFEAIILANDRLERWKQGEQVSSQSVSKFEDVADLGVSSAKMGGQFFAMSAGGSLAVAILGQTTMLALMNAEGEQRWRVVLPSQGMGENPQNLYISPLDNVLYHTEEMHGPGSSLATLYFVSPDGEKKRILLTRVDENLLQLNGDDISNEELTAFLQQQATVKQESVRKVMVDERVDGGFDVLFERDSPDKARSGQFLVHISPAGLLEWEFALGTYLKDHGLENAKEFRVNDKHLELVSSVLVTFPTPNGKRRKYPQIAVSRIALDGSGGITRLLPLDQRYMEAALLAGDEGRQHLEGFPEGDPVLLTTLSGETLVVAKGKADNQPAVRFYEVTDDLMVYTEVWDANQARIAKEASRQQRKADRASRMSNMRADQAAAAGMSESEFNALGKNEQLQAIVANGGQQQLMATAQREAALVQQQMAADPNMTPEMKAQMNAVLAQMAQMQGGSVPTVAPQAMPVPRAKSAGNPDNDNAIVLDAGGGAFLEFENTDGRQMTLLIFDRNSGEELLKKDYADGVIYDYINFQEFDRPMDQLGILYREVSGMILADLTPVLP